MIRYRKELIEAIKRSEQKSIDISDFYIESNSKPYLSFDKKKELFKLFDSKVYCNPIEQVAGKCLDWNVKLQDQISSILSCDALLTFGYIEIHESKIFYTPLEEMDKWFAPNTIMKPLNEIHAWITLPSLEVIDITVIASIKHINNENFQNVPNYKHCIVCDPEDPGNTIIYKPLFVGIDFLFKTKMAV